MTNQLFVETDEVNMQDMTWCTNNKQIVVYKHVCQILEDIPRSPEWNRHKISVTLTFDRQNLILILWS